MFAKKILYAVVFIGLSLVLFAQENEVDAKISKIIKASSSEKEVLIDELKDDISKKTYSKTETKKTVDSNKSIDEKITQRETKSVPKSKCGSGKCGMGKCGSANNSKSGESHGSKCGGSASKCGGDSHGSKCGASKCGSGKCGSSN